jgi:hypothetical protein
MSQRHRRLGATLPPRYTVHPEHISSMASMPPRYTVHPEHKKEPRGSFLLASVYIKLI